MMGVALSLSGCGGDSGASSPTPGPEGPVDSRSCRDDFRPERVAAGENCDPAQNRFQFCPSVPGTEYARSRVEVIACEGVTVSTHQVNGGGFNNVEYLAIRRAGGGRPDGVYLALHYLGAANDYHANLTRMSELAKARNVLVLAPQAPSAAGPAGGSALARWPTSVTQDVESYLQLLDAVVADARGRFGASGVPLYASGLSNGVPMAYFYACGRANQVEAVLAVSGNQNDSSASACQPSRAVGLVILHGDSDVVVPYGGVVGLFRPIPENYTQFKTLNGCTGTDGSTTLSSDEGAVQIQYTGPCELDRRVVLATSLNNGHNWPGDDVGAFFGTDLGFGPFGPALNSIDATLQGYDLLRYAAGN